jgi:eukaryotic-like serine/threonine-protein kinase
MPEWLGKTIGNVRIEKLLARGGMAEVYLGTHLNLERPVAVKLLHSFIEEEPLLLERFHREAKVVAGLRHSNIVQIFDFATIDGHPYIVMEYLKGPTLATYLRHLHQRKKRIAPDQVARLLNELSAALDYAHKQGVVHRDIKPGNILLHNKNEDIPLDKPLTDDVEAIITDFGLVRIMNTASQTASGTVSGTPAYMSPEQARGDPTDHRTDIYSLGIVLYEMLAGRVPFEADSTLTILHMQIHTTPPAIPGIPAKVQAVLDRTLLKNPDERYQTTRELANDYSRSIGMTTQAETIREPHPESPVPIEAPAPRQPEPQPLPKPEPTQPEPPSKPVLTEAKPTPKPARSRTWIGVGLFALICLALLAFGAPRLLSALSNPSKSTETVSPVTPNTESSPSPSANTGLPSAEGMVQVPAGNYEVGKDPADNYHIAPQTIQLTNFWIDQYQTTNADYQQYLLANTGAPTPMVWPAASGDEKHPVRGVTWDQADAFCKWNNKRLPTEAEWEAAGRGSGQAPQLYPWGTKPDADGKTQNLPGQNTYEVGSQSFNKSPFGVFDMLGNVWEWVGDPYGSLEAGKKILHGSQYGNPLDLAFRVQVAPDDPNYVPYAGFRCAADQVR